MKTNQLQLVTYEQAKKLKELGFDWELNRYYWDFEHSEPQLRYGMETNWNDTIAKKYSAPTIALALKWFRDVKKIENEVTIVKFSPKKYRGKFYTSDDDFNTKLFETHEQAESALLDELLTILN